MDERRSTRVPHVAVPPAAQLGEPGEVAGLAVFLASDEAANVTGSTYYVDGGMSHWNRGL